MLRGGVGAGTSCPACDPSIAPGWGRRRGGPLPLSLSCPTYKEVRQSGVPESLLWPLIPSSGHCSPWCSVQDRCWNGARLPLSLFPPPPRTPGQPHLAPVGSHFCNKAEIPQTRFPGFLSSLRPPSLCWRPVLRPLPAGASRGEQNRINAQLW